MADVLKGLISASGAFVLSWVFPAAIGVAVIWTVLDRIGIRTPALTAMSPTEQALVVAAIAAAAGLILNGLSTGLYRVLEGYAWPARLRVWGVRRQVRRRSRLKELAASATAGTDRSFVMEALQRFPADEQEMAPTALGNALRAFETYGVDRYRLDSQTFWSDLVTVVPESLRAELTTARASVDFFVALYFVSLITGTVALIGGVVGIDPWVTALGLAAIGSLQVWYLSAVASSTYWDATVRALVDLGRKPLAEALDLELPRTIEREREMWSVIGAFAYYPFDETWASRTDEFRSRGGASSETNGAAPAKEVAAS